jgi:hypothetical protein
VDRGERAFVKQQFDEHISSTTNTYTKVVLLDAVSYASCFVSNTSYIAIGKQAIYGAAIIAPTQKDRPLSLRRREVISR